MEVNKLEDIKTVRLSSEENVTCQVSRYPDCTVMTIKVHRDARYRSSNDLKMHYVMSLSS
jgi:hypothetical protein